MQGCSNLALVLFAKDVERIAQFYEQTLSLVRGEAESSHTLLEGLGIEIVIHAISKKFAKQIVIDNPPKSRDSTVFKPVFM